jgi:hypothetical protein
MAEHVVAQILKTETYESNLRLCACASASHSRVEVSEFMSLKGIETSKEGNFTSSEYVRTLL